MRVKKWFISCLLLLCSIGLFGQTPELQENQAILTQYMHTFQMDGWHIQLVMVDKSFLDNVMKNKTALAASQMNMQTGYGVIWVLKRSEYGPKMFKALGMNPQDDEWVIVDQRNSVVHELIHIIWSYCGDTETCVGMLAEAVIPHEDTKWPNQISPGNGVSGQLGFGLTLPIGRFSGLILVLWKSFGTRKDTAHNARPNNLCTLQA